MDKFERARALREEYESVLDTADEARQAYHREVMKLHRSGLTLREIADGLGLSHQRVHQIVGTEERSRGGRRGAVIVTSVVVVLGGIVAGIALSGRSHLASTGEGSARSQATSGNGPRAIPCEPRPTTLQQTLDLASSDRRVGTLRASSLYPVGPSADCERSLTYVAVIDPKTGDILALMEPELGSDP